MRSSIFVFAALAVFCSSCAAVGVVGKPEGFAASTTGGGSATPQYPKDINELTTWLTDSVARVIVLNKD
jgi:pectin lyase